MNRRRLLQTTVLAAAGLPSRAKAQTAAPPATRRKPFVTAGDGTHLFVRDWGAGSPVLFVSPWGMNSTWWEYPMTFLAARGMRCIAYDRRGHGRSEEPGCGYELNTLADDLGAVIEQLDLRGLTLVGHSLGCGEAVHYLSRAHTSRVARTVLVSTIAPLGLKTADNPTGAAPEVLANFRARLSKDRPHAIGSAAAAFFGPHNAVPDEVMQWWTRMLVDGCSLKVMADLQKASSETDFRPGLRSLSGPVLLIHGDSDTSAPLETTGRKTAALIPGSRLIVYEGAAHGLPYTHADRLIADIAAFAGS